MSELLSKIDLPLEEFRMMREYIHEKTGMYFGDNKVYLVKGRLVRRMEELGIATFRDYLYRVKYDTSLAEFNRLMDLVTTNETSFYRNEPQLQSFAEEALPLIIKRKKANGERKSLRIWSAGCSTGEEPYTLGILIREALGIDTGWSVEIFANDISERVVQAARLGEYAQMGMKGIPERISSRYFEKVGDKYRVKPEIKAMVKFAHLNLSDTGKFSVYSELDFIFCRNVIIYFSDDMKKKLFRAFYQCLSPGGLLYLGHSETLHGISKAFKLTYFKGALVYEKDANGDSANAEGESIGSAGRSANNLQATGAASGAERAMALLQKLRSQSEGRAAIMATTPANPVAPKLATAVAQKV